MAIREENSIGFRIVQAFSAKDLKEVAQVIGENYSSLHNWSSQRRDFPTNVLIKIAKLANTSIDWILTGENGSQGGVLPKVNFDSMMENKIREIIREEIENSQAIQEKVQGVILAMKPNIIEQSAFEKTGKEEKAA